MLKILKKEKLLKLPIIKQLVNMYYKSLAAQFMSQTNRCRDWIRLIETLRCQADRWKVKQALTEAYKAIDLAEQILKKMPSKQRREHARIIYKIDAELLKARGNIKNVC